jgi:UDP-N-acetylmuramoyl-L-alanyl-D-glutamate--2,6-diaminopimelate ligase
MLSIHDYTDVHYDSRKVIPGSIFVAIRGEKFDGHEYIDTAIKNGATCIVAETQVLVPEAVKLVQVQDSRLELARLSSEFYANPSSKLKIIGVTGTNGKTTVTHLVQALLTAHANKTALLGTMGLKLSPEAQYQDMGNTTPQSKEVHKILADLVDKNYQYLTMEVSSHALEQQRVAGIEFQTAIVTNLTQDHLDYHVTMDNYFQAKARIFKQVNGSVILNVDDEYYSRFKSASSNLKLCTFGIFNNADYMAINIQYTNAGLSYDLIKASQQLGSIKMKLNGQFNVYNSLAAIAAAGLEGMQFSLIQKILENIPPVTGRFEVIKTEHSPFCIVDYAHSPDGILNVLKGARELTKGKARLICLFGCGGDRDITKRPKMAKIAYELADFIYVTSDNPRSEDPDQIIADILTGIPDLNKVKVISDRRQAIQEAVLNANADDVLVVAGKGHEDYQILKDRTIHFDDREQVREAIALVRHCEERT